jgi:predicted lipoprotein
MKKLLFTAIIAILGYNSVYFKKLSDVKKQKKTNFNFNAFADSLYNKGILKSTKAIDLNELQNQIQANPDSAFKAHGNRLGIGNSAFFMVKSVGKVVNITEGKIKISTFQNAIISVDAKYIFGNAIRDASGLVKLTDFKTNADFNKVSEALNTIIREKVLPPITKNIKVGDEISVVGALKLSKKEILSLEVLPVQIQIVISDER